MTAGDTPAPDEAPAGDIGPAGSGAVRRRVRIVNSKGLHARAAAKFAKTAGGFKARIQVVKGDQTVSALSIMGLMMLAAVPGSELELVASGADADAAVQALATLIDGKFEEDDAEA